MSAVISVLVLSWVFREVYAQDNNVCPSYRDYDTIKTNKKCWYDFAADSKAPEIIHKSGYPVLEYKVTTKDGYILTMYRIPNSNFHPKARKDPVFLLHGIACTCSNFISSGKSSLAFLLANEGHDIWLGNYRGNEYSQGHVNLTVHDKEYWEHGVDEIALFDVPAMLSVIEQETRQKGNIIYIGHSLGTTMGMMYASEYPEEAKSRVKLFIWISPSHKLTNMISPFRLVSPFYPLIATLLNLLEGTRLVSQAEPTRNIVKEICLESSRLMRLCMLVFNLFFGPFMNMGPERIPVFFNQIPGGTGLRVYGSLVRQIRSTFAKHDYGWRNFDVYGSRYPPEYNVSKIQVPCHIIYGVFDWATTRADAINLYKSLSEDARYGLYGVTKINFNHIDFVLGREAKVLVYDHVLQLIKKFKGKR